MGVEVVETARDGKRQHQEQAGQSGSYTEPGRMRRRRVVSLCSEDCNETVADATAANRTRPCSLTPSAPLIREAPQTLLGPGTGADKIASTCRLM